MLSSVRISSTGTADTLIEVGRFLLEARAASRRAAEAGRPSPRPRAAEPPQHSGPGSVAG